MYSQTHSFGKLHFSHLYRSSQQCKGLTYEKKKKEKDTPRINASVSTKEKLWVGNGTPHFSSVNALLGTNVRDIKCPS